jgi:hypothetical protein
MAHIDLYADSYIQEIAKEHDAFSFRFAFTEYTTYNVNPRYNFDDALASLRALFDKAIRANWLADNAINGDADEDGEPVPFGWLPPQAR